jgi:hypothetical protein
LTTPFGRSEWLRSCQQISGTMASIRSSTAAAFSWMPPA